MIDLRRRFSRAVDALRPNEGQTEAKQMAEALLQMAVTYRSIILPLITAVESRMALAKALQERIQAALRLKVDPRDEAAAEAWNRGKPGGG